MGILVATGNCGTQVDASLAMQDCTIKIKVSRPLIVYYRKFRIPPCASALCGVVFTEVQEDTNEGYHTSMKSLSKMFDYTPVFDSKTRARATKSILNALSGTLWIEPPDVATSIYSPGAGYYALSCENALGVLSVFCGMEKALRVSYAFPTVKHRTTD